MRNLMKWQFIALLGIFILGSCATSNDVVSGNFISKRKYNKGFHLNFHKNYKTTKPAEQVEEIETVAYTPIEAANESASQEANTYSSTSTIEENTIFSSSKQTDVVTDSAKESITSERKSDEEQQTKAISKNTQKIINFVQETKEKQSSSKGSDSDVKLILLVILAFIISPLAMYLADGQTDLWFILDLIFYLFWISWIFAPNLGFVGLASIVIALLRVFGII